MPALNSYIAVTSGRSSRSGWLRKASGTRVIRLSVIERPLRTISSSVASRLAESLKAGLTTGLSSAADSPQTSERLASDALAQLRLPSSVLISPLWPSSRIGCARGQRGRVLVLKRR